MIGRMGQGRMRQGDGYLLDNQQAEAGARLAALAEVFDPATFRHLDGLGIAPGWRCWEVGAGGPSVPWWLATRVGPAGRVLATDIDDSWLAGAGGPPVEVRRHEVGADAPPAGPFDLVHARLVLVHVVNRDAALRSMVEVLRPGGWLLIEDADPALQPLACPDEHGPEQRLANRVRAAVRRLYAERGVDLGYGRTLPRRLRTAGLTAVRAEASFPVATPASAALEAATVSQLRDRLLAAGGVTAAELDGYLAAIAAGRLDLTTAPMISAWGQRPGPAGPR